MSLLNEFTSEAKILNKEYDHHLSLVESYMELAYADYDQQVEHAEMSYLAEKTSDNSSFEYMCEEAKESLDVKMKKAFDKITTNNSEFFSGISAKVAKLTANMTANGKLKKIKGKIDQNPFLKKTTVVFMFDSAYVTNTYDKMIDSILKIALHEDMNAVSDLDASFTKIVKDHKETEVQIKVEALIASLIKRSGSLNDEVNAVKDQYDKVIHSLNAVRPSSTEHDKEIKKLKILVGKICHRKANCLIDYYVKSISELSKVIKKAKNVGPTNESVSDDSVIESFETDQPNDDKFMKDLFDEMYAEYVSDQDSGATVDDVDHATSTNFNDFVNSAFTESLNQDSTECETSHDESFMRESSLLDDFARDLGFNI